MKKLIAITFIALLFLPACQKDQAVPEVELEEFSIKELPEVVFTFDNSTEPIRITNTVLLPVNKDIESLTSVFALTSQGSLFSQDLEIITGVSTLNFSDPLFLKTLGSDGEIDHYYQIEILVESVTAPEITELEFTLNPYGNTPLAGLLEIKLDRACILEIKIKGQDDNDLIKLYPNPSTNFSVPVLGLYEQATNNVVITLTDQYGDKSQESLFITTDPLPDIYPGAEIIVSKPEKMEYASYAS